MSGDEPANIVGPFRNFLEGQYLPKWKNVDLRLCQHRHLDAYTSVGVIQKSWC
jgi:hypothetical protein